MLAGLPYVVWPVGSIFILVSRKKDDPFLHYHAVQGGIFGAVMLVLSVVGFIGLGIAFRLMPGSSTYLPGMLGMATLAGAGLVAALIFFTAIFLGWRATEGEMIRLPFAGDFAEGKMLDHTGMTRREFMEMLEKSFIEPVHDEPEAIPFPAYGSGTPAVTGRAAELIANHAAGDTTPAAQKAAELLAHRQAKQAAAQQAQAAQAAALAAAQKAADLAAQQAAALHGVARPPAANGSPGRPPSSAPPAQQRPPATAQRPAANGPAAAGQRPPTAGQPTAQAPAAAAKNYSLIRESASTGVAPGGNVLQPSPPQRSAQPPQKTQTPAGWQHSPGSAAPMPPQQSTPGGPRPSGNTDLSGTSSAPQVKEVDLIRHYKERRSAATQQSDALRNWLSAVDEGT